MKKLVVRIVDKHTLVLEEDAEKGDVIDLRELSTIDEDHILKTIEEETDKVYQKKLEEYKKSLDLSHQIEISQLKSTIQSLKENKEKDDLILKQEIQSAYDKKIADLNSTINDLKHAQEMQNQKAKEENNAKVASITTEKDNKINELKVEIETLKRTTESQINAKLSEAKLQFEKEQNKIINDSKLKEERLNGEINLLKNTKDNEIQLILGKANTEFQNTIREKEKQIEELRRQRAALNVKMIGEDLESWCDNVVKEYMQNGLSNCTWIKDNEVVKEEDELKGSKADYIFKVYATDKHLEEEILSSVCMDMKSENPDSIHKKTNESYFKQLDKNRNKKGCKYALLVSELEMDKPNYLPMYKVSEYEDMYVVRPQYLMTFLNMIVSLSKCYSSLLVEALKEELVIKDKKELMEQFDDLKLKCLDKPLAALEKEIEKIANASKKIKEASNDIDESIVNINAKYINIIENKIETFEAKITKAYKKIEK